MQKRDLKKLIRKHITESVSWIPPVGRKSFIRLDLNEGYGSLKKNILSDLKKFDSFVVTSYPEYDALNTALAKYTGMNKKNICLTNGSDHAIQMLLNLFFNEKDRVVVPAPTFFVYFSTLKLIGVKTDVIIHSSDSQTFVFPFEKTMEAITPKIKGLLLCSPNNPLGFSIPHHQMIALLKKCHIHKIPVIIDEAYFEYSGISTINLISKYSNVIILRTFSKAFGLAGLRLGYVVAHPNVIEELIKLRLPWAVNHFAVHAGVIALKHLSSFKKELAITLARKKEFTSFLRRQGIFCYKTDTNFLIIKVNDHKKFSEQLRARGILVSDISHYPYGGSLLENCIRINIPTKNDYNRVKETISQLSSQKSL